MTIYRDGKEYALTEEEMEKAYLEQDHKYNLENIKDSMDYYLNPEDYNILKDNNDFVKEVTDRYEREFVYGMNEADFFLKIFNETKVKYL